MHYLRNRIRHCNPGEHADENPAVPIVVCRGTTYGIVRTGLNASLIAVYGHPFSDHERVSETVFDVVAFFDDSVTPGQFRSRVEEFNCYQQNHRARRNKKYRRR